jgi:lipopolysaccharide transport system ATP-binding protein
MSDIAIKIENLSKQYRLGNVGTGTLATDLQRWWAKARGKEDPTLVIGGENILSERGGDYVYALKDINLEIKQGEILGVVGKNGAGKSTLLKVLSKVTTPSTGTIDLYGRVASLLEVGTGFHPELTGRENIFLNGAIMGMTKREIRSKFDEIVDFSGVGKYIDTPVKRYSSGMYVRLAFGVSAHLDPEILIVDEVLAVGDADFQKKAIGKMQDVSKNEGRTVLFVSHSMTSIKALCSAAVFMQNGQTKGITSVQQAVNQYMGGDFQIKGTFKNEAVKINAPATVLEARIFNEKNQVTESFYTYQPIFIEITWKNNQGVNVIPNFMLVNRQGVCVMIASDAPVDWDGSKKNGKSVYRSKFKIPANLLNANEYALHLALDCASPKMCYENHMDALNFSITDPMDENCIARGELKGVREDAILYAALECSFDKLD